MRNNNSYLLLLATLFASCLSGSRLYAQTTITHPFPQITLTDEVRANPPLHLHWVTVDLSNPAVHLRVCPGGLSDTPPWEVTLDRVSAIARREHLDVAVNGSYFGPRDKKVLFGIDDPYFKGNYAMANGWTVCDRLLLSDHPLSTDFSTLVIAGNGQAYIKKLAGPPLGARQAVSGIALLRDGQNITGDAFNTPEPRTAAGLDATRKILTLLVVDGHRPNYSPGLTAIQLGDEMKKLGCDSAISLDGGGSSTLVIRSGDHWPVINTPSDGHALLIPLSIERPVAEAVGITIDEPEQK